MFVSDIKIPPTYCRLHGSCLRGYNLRCLLSSCLRGWPSAPLPYRHRWHSRAKWVPTCRRNNHRLCRADIHPPLVGGYTDDLSCRSYVLQCVLKSIPKCLMLQSYFVTFSAAEPTCRLLQWWRSVLLIHPSRIQREMIIRMAGIRVRETAC